MDNSDDRRDDNEQQDQVSILVRRTLSRGRHCVSVPILLDLSCVTTLTLVNTIFEEGAGKTVCNRLEIQLQLVSGHIDKKKTTNLK